MAIIIGSARIDERGSISGGAAGDQKQSATPDYKGEVSLQTFYVHSKGWYILRPKSAHIATLMAQKMKQACNNPNLGYDQNQRYGVIQNGTGSKAKTECDCSSLVRACVKEASGKDPGDFNTATEASVLEKSGLFESKKAYSSGTALYTGDVLVTKTKGHTVIVTDGLERDVPTNPAVHVPLNYIVGQTYKVVCTELNIRTKKASDDPFVIPNSTIIGTLKNGASIKNQATTLVNGKIWMYFGLDSKGRERWSCADSGTVAYIA